MSILLQLLRSTVEAVSQSYLWYQFYSYQRGVQYALVAGDILVIAHRISHSKADGRVRKLESKRCGTCPTESVLALIVLILYRQVTCTYIYRSPGMMAG